MGRRGRPDPGFAGNLPRRASDEPPRRIAGGSHETGPFRRAADAECSATPIAPGSIARLPRSSSRTSWTHEQRLPTGPPARPTSRRIRPGARRAQRARTTTRRPPDDDPLRRWTARHAAGPSTGYGHVRRRVAARLSNRTGSGSGNGYGNGRGNGYGNGRSRRGSGGGHHGILRFLVFALVLAAIVLVSLVTVLRPVVQGAVVDWASDNPGALGISFVADMVRADLGPKLTDPASTDTEQVNFTIGSGETATTIAQRLETEGFLADRRSFVLLAVERDLASQLQVGHVHPAEVDDARPARDRAAEAGDDAVHRHRAPDRPPARADHRQARDDPGSRDEPGRLPRAGAPSHHGAPRRLSVARPAGRRVARGLPLARDLPRPARHDARGAGPAHARQVQGRDRRPDERARVARDDLAPGADPRVAGRARGDARQREAADRRRLPEPARSQALPQRPSRVRRDGVLRERHAPARQHAGRAVEGVRLLDHAEGQPAGRPSARPRRATTRTRARASCPARSPPRRSPRSTPR